MEFEASDTLRVLHCCHAEHAECVDQWLLVNKSCPLCQKDINATPLAASDAPSTSRDVIAMSSPVRTLDTEMPETARLAA